MKKSLAKFILLLLLILINFSCSSSLEKNSNSIDRKVTKIENRIGRKLYTKQVCWDCVNIDAIVYITQNKSEVKKVDFEIEGNEIAKEYSRKCQIYFENNIPILITENVNAKYIHEVDGNDKMKKERKVFKEEFSTTKNVKIYISDWGKFDVAIVGGNKDEYNLKAKQKYDETINKVLAQVMKK